MSSDLLSDRGTVITCLLTYNDWWQPATTSLMSFSRIKRKPTSDGLHPGLVDTLETRAELSRRVRSLPSKDRELLFLWYVKQLHVDDVSAHLKISRRQCFRRRSRAIEAIAEMGHTDRVA